MQVAPVQLKNGYKNNTTCKSGAMNDIIWLVQGGIYISTAYVSIVVKALVLVAQELLFYYNSLCANISTI